MHGLKAILRELLHRYSRKIDFFISITVGIISYVNFLTQKEQPYYSWEYMVFSSQKRRKAWD